MQLNHNYLTNNGTRAFLFSLTNQKTKQATLNEDIYQITYYLTCFACVQVTQVHQPGKHRQGFSFNNKSVSLHLGFCCCNKFGTPNTSNHNMAHIQTPSQINKEAPQTNPIFSLQFDLNLSYNHCKIASTKHWNNKNRNNKIK